MTKVGFIGAGRVGATSAFTCMLNMDVDIALVDIAKEIAEGEAEDLSHAASALGKFPNITGGGDYSLLEGCEVVVVSAGMARKPGMTRLDLAEKNAEIIKKIAEKIAEYCHDAKVIVVTNPMDLMNYVMWKELNRLCNKSRNEVFGMGGLLDTSRLRLIAKREGLNCGKALVIGEHGDSMFIPEIAGECVDILEKTREVAMEVIKKKGATIFGPSVCIYRMVRAVVEDTGEIIPASVVLCGEYGIEDVSLGLPVRISRKGAEIIDYSMGERDLKNLKKSAEILKEWLRKIGY
jgi:malate dehydrogenase